MAKGLVSAAEIMQMETRNFWAGAISFYGYDGALYSRATYMIGAGNGIMSIQVGLTRALKFLETGVCLSIILGINLTADDICQIFSC